MPIDGHALRGAHPNEPTTQTARVFVTGGYGFLGSAVVRKLVHAGFRRIDRPTHNEVILDDGVGVYDWIEDHKPDIIVHCAAQCGGIGANAGNGAMFLHNNLRMGLDLLHAAWINGVRRVIIIGSVCAYPGSCPQPMKEDDLWNGWPEPTNAYYGIAKRTVMAAADAYRKQYGMSTLNLVLTNLYGPGDNFNLETSHVVPAIIRKMHEAPSNGALSLWGDGTPTRDLLYVEDAAAAIVRAVQCPEVNGTINIASGESYAIDHIAAIIRGIMEWNGEINWDTTKPNGQQNRRLDTTRAADWLGWRSSTTLTEGLDRTIRSFLEQQPAVQAENPVLQG